MEFETQFIVIDDIDTLVSSNEDLGMEQLFSVIARCAGGTKVLYTQRNLPSKAYPSESGLSRYGI
jgi:hypothetical protein